MLSLNSIARFVLGNLCRNIDSSDKDGEIIADTTCSATGQVAKKEAPIISLPGDWEFLHNSVYFKHVYGGYIEATVDGATVRFTASVLRNIAQSEQVGEAKGFSQVGEAFCESSAPINDHAAIKSIIFAMEQVIKVMERVLKDICGSHLDPDYLRRVSLLVGGAAQAIETWSEDELEKYATSTRAGKMTSEQHEAKSKSLERKIARKRSAKKAAGALADKLSIDREIKALQEELRQHRLNYFELVVN